MNFQARYQKATLWIILIPLLIAAGCEEQESVPIFTESNTGPYVLNVDYLEHLKENIREKSYLNAEYLSLIEGADQLLSEEFLYVTDKYYTPPSGDKHDYMSLSRYLWPDSTGAYTIYRDGVTNPEIYNYDRPKLAAISFASYTLALAYYYTGEEAYASKASELIRGWFLNPETKMNPNMDHAQVAPGVNNGSGQGIIDANDFIPVLDAVSLIYDSPSWTFGDHKRLKEWFFQFSTWLERNYNTDAYSTTNVSIWMDAQRAIYYLFTEQTDRLNSNSHIPPVTDRIGKQFNSQGEQPNEITRARPMHYVYFNLLGYMNLTMIRKNIGKNDRDWQILNSPNYGGLKPAIDLLVSLMQGKSVGDSIPAEPKFDLCRYIEIFLPASVAFESKNYEEEAFRLLREGCSNPSVSLVYPKLSDYDESEAF